MNPTTPYHYYPNTGAARRWRDDENTPLNADPVRSKAHRYDIEGAIVRRLLAAGVVEPYVPDWVPRAAELRASIVQAPAPQRDYRAPNAAPAARRSLAVLAPFICLLVVAVVVLNVVWSCGNEV